MRSEEDKDKEETKDEESESESENEEEKEDLKKISNINLSEIKMDEDGKILGIKFNKENCAEAGLLEKKRRYRIILKFISYQIYKRHSSM